METNKRKSSYGLTRSQERAASRYFGKHVSPDKALLTLIASLLACAVPMLLGLRLWSQIPEIVETGLIGPGGEDDSLPRAVLVFGIPGLMCVLNLICHVQLWLHQKAQRVPPTPIRLLGRWTIPVLSVLLSGFWIMRAAHADVSFFFYLPCILAFLLILSGAHFFDCSRGSRMAFHLKHIEYKDQAWRKTHQTAGFFWMLAGLQLLIVWFGMGTMSPYSALITGMMLLLPLPLSHFFAKTE